MNRTPVPLIYRHAREVKPDRDHRERYSARQDTRMKMGGFVGKVDYQGNLAEFVPLLKLGERVHVGKGTAFGLGRYEIEEESL